LVTAAFSGQWRRLVTALLCGVGAFAFYYAINFIRPGWLGFGDVRLAALLGLALGWMGPWYLFIGFMAANLLGAAVGIGLIVANKARRTTPLPYGVFLAAGSLFALWFGAGIISWYSHHVTH
jgi:leader peptidase (prepilin peptidase)/N-methyltransferase